jgi:hypothetical protein
MTPRRSRRRKATRPYHHGALREALLDAAERILDQKGTSGLTLRAGAVSDIDAEDPVDARLPTGTTVTALLDAILAPGEPGVADAR